MNDIAPKNKLATASLTLSLMGWVFYLLQWCYDLTIGILLAAVTAGTSAICSTVFDVLPFLLWLIGIITGHVALGQIRQSGEVGRNRAIWSLVLSYFGVFFVVIVAVFILMLIGTGIGVGFLSRIFPFLQK